MSAQLSGNDVHGAVVTTLAALDLDDEDVAAQALALSLASALDREDSGRTRAELAGKLLATLESLGATPAARKAVLPRGGPVERTPEQRAKDELKARRAAKADAS
jgi:hypothetical protein